MVRTSYERGAREALRQFNIREASILDVLLGVSTPVVARAALRNLAPNLVPTIDKGLDSMFQAGKRLVGKPTPETALVKALGRGHLPQRNMLADLYHERSPLMGQRK